jgi:hypothetical protein
MWARWVASAAVTASPLPWGFYMVGFDAFGFF